MNLPACTIESPFLASQAPSSTGFTSLGLMIVLVGVVLLFGLAFVFSILRVVRRRIARGRSTFENRAPVAPLVDPWHESGVRMPLEEEAPSEPDPDDDLPPMGGRFS